MTTRSIWRRDIIPSRYRRIWNGFLALTFLGVFYFLCVLVLAHAGVAIWVIFSFLWATLAAAGLTGILHFVIAGILQKARRRAIIPSIQVLVFFSAVPYIWFVAFLRPWGDVLVGPLSVAAVYLFAVLPELLYFVALACLKRRLRAAPVILILAAAATTIELCPVRSYFLAPASMAVMQRLDDPISMRPFGKHDREVEFKRSIETLNRLIVMSDILPVDDRAPLFIGLPLLEKNPDIFKPDTSESKTIGVIVSEFQLQEISLDTTADTDGDGLSDFREAELLSDPREEDTDGDGLNDGRDSDPLNPVVVSHYADINASVLEYITRGKTPPILVVENSFYKGRGEIANFRRHVILLSHDQAIRWDVVFGFRYGRRFYEGGAQLASLDSVIHVKIGRTLVSPSRRIAAVEVLENGYGMVLLLVRLQGEWRVIGTNLLWI